MIPIKSYYLKFFLFTTLICGIILLLNSILPELTHPSIWKTLFFLAILSFLIHLLNSFLIRNFEENFLQITVLAMILRFIASLVFIGWQVWPGLTNIILFIANFFALFLFYLVFDIYIIISTLRQNSK